MSRHKLKLELECWLTISKTENGDYSASIKGVGGEAIEQVKYLSGELGLSESDGIQGRVFESSWDGHSPFFDNNGRSSRAYRSMDSYEIRVNIPKESELGEKLTESLSAEENSSHNLADKTEFLSDSIPLKDIRYLFDSMLRPADSTNFACR